MASLLDLVSVQKNPFLSLLVICHLGGAKDTLKQVRTHIGILAEVHISIPLSYHVELHDTASIPRSSCGILDEGSIDTATRLKPSECCYTILDIQPNIL